jgi:F-type H+-transporting ATPase subunit epsilon
MRLQCEIITQERRVFDEEVDIVIAPGTEGEMGILPQHAPLIAALDYGELRVRQGGKELLFAIGGGVLQVSNDHVIVLADSAEQAEEIDVARAEAARQRARKTMEEGPPEDPEAYAALQAAIQRANLRLKVAAHRRPRRGTGPGAIDFESDRG